MNSGPSKMEALGLRQGNFSGEKGSNSLNEIVLRKN